MNLNEMRLVQAQAAEIRAARAWATLCGLLFVLGVIVGVML